MSYLSNYKSKLEDLKLTHKFVSNRLILLYILFGLAQGLFLGTIIAYAISNPEVFENVFPILIYVILYLCSFFLFIPIVKYTRGFTKGNLSEFIYDIISNETGVHFEPLTDIKEINNFANENTNILSGISFKCISNKAAANFELLRDIKEINNIEKEITNILSGISLSTNMCVNIYDETRGNVIARYSYVDITYNKSLSYSGFLITIPTDIATGDCKIFTKNFTQYSLYYKKDKENSNSLSHIFYNKKEEYHFDENLLKLHQEIDEYYNDTLSNKMSIGLLSKNKHLSIMFANNPKVHPKFVFKHKLTDEYLESLINAIIKDIKLIQNIASR